MQTLTDRQRAFCREYLIDMNGSAAYQRAGYRARGNAAEVGACQLLRNLKVRTEIDRLLAERAGRLDLDGDAIASAIYAAARFDIAELYDENENLKPVHEWSATARRVVQGLVTKARFNARGQLVSRTTSWRIPDRLRGLELLGRRVGLFTDVIEHRGLEGLGERLAQGRRQARLKVADD